MLLKERISRNIRRWRQIRGLTQYELADRCGFERSNIANLEQEPRSVGSDLIEIIAIQLQVEPDELLKNPEEKATTEMSKVEYEENLKLLTDKLKALEENFEESCRRNRAIIREFQELISSMKQHTKTARKRKK